MKEPFLYKIVRPVIQVLFKFLFQPTYIGISNIPKSGRAVLAGNHTNNLDCILLISATSRPIHFLAKEELMQGFKKIIFKNMGIIPVNRRIHDKNALHTAIEVLNNDKVIGIFPEGTINKTDDIIMPFKFGAVKMANATESILIPFTITGKYKIFQKSITLEFYEPCTITDNLEAENQMLMKKIETELKKKGGKK